MLRAYLLAFTALKSGRKIQMSWSAPALDLEGFRREFMLALHRRINLKVAGKPQGRKYTSDYCTHCWRDQRSLADIGNRIRVHQFETDECRARFGHLLSSYGD